MTVHGLAVLTACSKAGRYSSRSVRSSTSALTDIRRVSWLLTARCFSDAPTPSDCTPSIHPTARRPARNGSSEKYSKFRPQSGDRFMLTPGPRTTSTSRAIASRPIASPISRTRSGSHVAAVLEAVGKQVAAVAPNAIDPVECVRRTPWGPSAIRSDGRPRRGMAAVVHAESPVSSVAFSSRVISARWPRAIASTLAEADVASGDRSRVSPSTVMAPRSRPGPGGSPRSCAGRAPALTSCLGSPSSRRPSTTTTDEGPDGGSNTPVVPNGRSTTAENDSPATRQAIDTGPCGASSEAVQAVIDSSGRGATMTRRYPGLVISGARPATVR